MRKALVVGIDAYPQQPLGGAVSDAVAIASALEFNGDGSPNFSVRRLISTEQAVTTAALAAALEQLFVGDADTVVFFFAGHGIINLSTNAGHLVTQNGTKGGWGISMTDLLSQANRAYPRIKSTVILLDSCHSGFTGEVASIGNDQLAVIGTGVTIVTATHREGKAEEDNRHGLFTGLLLEGLHGSAADVLGNVTPASLYSLVDQTLGPWEQRPLYKANVQSFVTLRQVAAKVPREILRKLPIYFPDPTTVFALDPSYEPDRESVPHPLKNQPVDAEHAAIFRELQRCNRHGLVVPVDAEHMYYAAINSKGCRLTAAGAHYRKLAEMKLI